MSIDETVRENPESHGFTISKRRKWPYIVIAVIVIAVVATYFIFTRGSGSQSANETAGATLQVVYLDSNPAEKSIIEYIGNNIAADYDIKVAAVGLGDSTQINGAISDGRYAGTIFQHTHWLQQVLDANPGFHEQAGPAPSFTGSSASGPTNTRRRRRFRTRRRFRCWPTPPTTPRASGTWRRPG
jgi:D-methionine transport system substrate-binding protein